MARRRELGFRSFGGNRERARSRERASAGRERPAQGVERPPRSLQPEVGDDSETFAPSPLPVSLVFAGRSLSL